MRDINHPAVTRATNENFHVSYVTGDWFDGCELHVSRIYRTRDEHLARRFLHLTQVRDEHLFMLPADHYGRRFETYEKAVQFAFEHGYTQEFFTALRPMRKERAGDPRAVVA